MTSISTYLTKGSQVFFTSWKSRIFPKKYEGNADQICHQIVKDCWNGRYFQTSAQNFPEFWTRDFGWCTQSLVQLGYRKEIHQTLRYAINRFKESDQITTTIKHDAKPFNFPTLAVDSLPWLIHSIKISGFHYQSYKTFLNRQIKLFFEEIIDKHTGLVNPNRNFSSIKDFAIRKSSCYDNSMVGLLAMDLKSMKLVNPFKEFDYPDLLKRHFWEGNFFRDDLQKTNYVAADANLFPFIFGLVKDKVMIQSAIQSIQDDGLDYPFPLKYTRDSSQVKFIWQEKMAMRGYESDAIWSHMGPLFIKLVKQFDKKKAREYIELYREQIEKSQGFLEVFNAKGKPYHTWYYFCDRSMLWAANYLTLSKVNL
jgi:hypothetical protein